MRLVAQAGDDVTLLAGAVHTVTLQPYNGMQWTVAPDPQTTVPWGPAPALPLSGGVGGGTNTGQAQIPGAAYLATLTNTSTIAHTFRVEVTPDGFPAAWIALGGAGWSTTTTLTLAAGSVGRLGVYIAPVGLASLPPASTQYPFTVRAVAADALALDQSAPAVFTMPAVPFNYLTAAPETLLATASVPATFDVTLTNVGNVSETFAVQAVAPAGWVAGAPYSLSLAVGARETRAYTFIAAGARPGATGVIRVQSPAPGSPYVQADTVAVRIVGPCTFAAAQAAQAAAALDDTALTVALDDLTTQLNRWEQDTANASRRARVQAAITLLQTQVARYPQLDAAAFAPLTATAVITDFCAPLAGLDADLSRLAARRVSARFIPGYDAALRNTPITYTLRLQNHGTLTTTYRINLQLSQLANQQIHNQQISHPGTTWLAVIAPSQVMTQPVVLLPASLGAWQLTAQVEAVGDAFIQAAATAGLNVVDAYVKGLAVNANPAFVETGVNSTTLAVQIANIANVPRAVTAQAAILAPDATPVWTDSVALALQVGAPRAYALGAVTTSGWAAGMYTLTVDLQDARGMPVPDGAGYGYLGVGQALHVTHGVSPTLVAPGTVTVTTEITTEIDSALDDDARLLDLDMGLAQGGEPPATSRTPGLGARLTQVAQPFTRYEETGWTYTGSWSTVVVTRASGGAVRQATAAGAMASLTFTGTWAHVGFATAPAAGTVSVYVDGQYQGAVALAASEDVTGTIYADLGAGTHTLTLTTQSAAPVLLDFADVWSGASMIPERFEDDATAYVHLSGGGSQGSIKSTDQRWYTYTEGLTNAWFLFTGDTVRIEGVTVADAAVAESWVDGAYQDTFDLSYEFTASPVAQTRSGLGSGPHVLRLKLGATARLDALDTTATPFVGVPMVEWWDSAPAGRDGVLTTAAAGDLDGDGVTEVVVVSDDGFLYVYRGDGLPGSASQYLSAADLYSLGQGGGAPILVNLDNSPGVEVVLQQNGRITTFQFNPVIKTLEEDWHYTTGGNTGYENHPTVANLDAEPLPEIVLSLENNLYVLSATGALSWTRSFTETGYIGSPTLADVTGDGYPDILVVAYNHLYLFDYAQNPTTPEQVWVKTLGGTAGRRAVPAVADMEGHLVGGDPGPEIVLALEGMVEMRDADGNLLSSITSTFGTAPGPATIADLDGDGVVEIVTSMRTEGGEYAGKIYALKIDGAGQLQAWWDAPANDSSSGTGVSVHDFNADGIWDVLWNGLNQGMTIFQGNNGQILFNEPLVNSQTKMDYPITADVDMDGHAEIVAGDKYGIYVIGHDVVWSPARPLWSEYNYRVTNIADDFTVPPQEPYSWEVHNTYRTQVPTRNPAPAYQIDLTHTVPLSGMAVLTPTFTYPPDTAAPAYHWAYKQYWYQAPRVTGFAAQLPDMQPNEVRQVSEQTELDYCLASGCNTMSLAPLYVSAAHLVAVEPYSATVGAGSQTRYAVTLFNPAPASAVYSLTLAGLPPAWGALPATVTVGAGEQQTVYLTVAPPEAAERLTQPFVLLAETAGGSLDQTQGELTVVDNRLQVSLAPGYALAGYGDVVTYTLTVSNAESVARVVALDLAGLDADLFALPASLSVAAHSAATTTLAVTARAPRGMYGFEVTASSIQDGNVTQGQTRGVLHLLSEPGLDVALSPQTATAGPASLAVYTLVLTNTGTLSDTYQFNVVVPDGWTYALAANGDPITQVTLTPYLFNVAELYLTLTPPAATATGNYPFTVQAASTSNPAVAQTITGAAQLTGRGVAIALSPKTRTADPRATLTWNVTVTNTGNAPDTFELFPGGIIAAGAEGFISSTVSLAAGASTTVVMTATALDFALAQTYPIAVQARSLADPAIFSADEGAVTFTHFTAVNVAITPTMQTLTDTTTAYYLVVVTNTGNVDTVYTFTAASDPALAGLDLEIGDLYIPPHMAAQFLLTARAAQPGPYTLIVQAAYGTLAMTATAQLSVTDAVFNHPPVAVNDTFTTPMNVAVTTPVLANDSDPDGDALTLDMVGAASHGWVYRSSQDQLIYTPDTGLVGSDSFTYTLRDVHGSLAGATVTLQVNSVYSAPLVSLGPDRDVKAGHLLQLTAVLTDADTPTGHTSLWDLGDGTHITDTLTVAHTYATVGVYTVTLTVTDTTGLSTTDHLRVTVTPDCILVGEALTFTGDYTDPGWLDTHTLTWTFGDGATALNSLTATHAYTAPGIYEVRLTVRDDDGGVGYDVMTITVGCPACVTLQPGVLGDAADATLWAGDPDATGDGVRLYTGYATAYDPAGRAGGRLFRPVANLPGGSGPMRMLLWFDLTDAELPTSAAVVSATLGVYQSSAGSGDTVNVHRVTATWGASTVTWNSFGSSFATPAQGAFTTTPAAGWQTVGVTSLVRAWRAGTYLNYGFLLDSPAATAYTVYPSSEATTVTQRPWLQVCYLD